MLKLLPIVLILVIQNSFASNWVEIGQAGTATVFLEADSIDKTQGSVITYWKLMNLDEPKIIAGNSVSSIRSRETVNCKSKQYRIDLSTLFTGSMGAGQPIQDRGDTKSFTYIAPDTVAERIMNILCKK